MSYEKNKNHTFTVVLIHIYELHIIKKKTSRLYILSHAKILPQLF